MRGAVGADIDHGGVPLRRAELALGVVREGIGLDRRAERVGVHLPVAIHVVEQLHGVLAGRQPREGVADARARHRDHGFGYALAAVIAGLVARHGDHQGALGFGDACDGEHELAWLGVGGAREGRSGENERHGGRRGGRLGGEAHHR